MKKAVKEVVDGLVRTTEMIVPKITEKEEPTYPTMILKKRVSNINQEVLSEILNVKNLAEKTSKLTTELAEKIMWVETKA